MAKLTGVERMFRALALKEPDTVPTMELFIDPKVRNAILPDASHEEFIDFMDIDAIVITDVANERYEILDKTKGVIRDKWGVVKRSTGELDSVPVDARIKSEKDFDNYIPPDPDLPWRYDELKSAVKRFKGQRAVVAFVIGVFCVVNEIRGMADHFMDVKRNPDLIEQLNQMVLDYNMRYIKNCIEVGADIVWIGGDFATNFGPMLSPKLMEKFAIAPLKAQVDVCKKYGVPAMKHTDGDLESIFEMLIGTGLDGIHPIDPVAGMDIGKIKDEYGHRICLAGNIDCAQLLSWGTKDEVSQAVKDCIAKAGVGGGFICASSNTIHSGVNPENYVAMVEAIRKYGSYPLSL